MKMRIKSSFLISLTLRQVISENREDQNSNRIFPSSPEDVGLAHTKVIHNLQHKFETKLPQNAMEYLHEVSLEMRKIACDENDAICNADIVKKIREIQPGLEQGVNERIEHVKSILPNKFDPEVISILEDLYLGSKLAKIKSAHHVLSFMNERLEDLRHSETISNDDHRLVGMLAYSVGIESTKQWAEVLSNPKNPFHLIPGDNDSNNRKLQEMAITDSELDQLFTDILQSDISGAVSGAISALGFVLPTTIMGSAMSEATIASLKSFMAAFISNPQAIDPDCTFPNAFWCDDNNESDEDEPCMFPGTPFCNNDDNDLVPNGLNPCLIPNNPFCTGNNETITQIEGDDDCKFPNLPFCGEINGTLGGLGNLAEGKEDDGCLFPGSPMCDETQNNTVIGNLNNIDICSIYPNLPICVDSDISDVYNEEINVDVIPQDYEMESNNIVGDLNSTSNIPDNNNFNLCARFPNLPSCNTINTTDADNINESISTENIVETTTEVLSNETVVDVIENAGTNLCARFPSLPSCITMNNSVVEDFNENNLTETITETNNDASNNDISVNVSETEEDTLTQGNAIALCEQFPNLPSCVTISNNIIDTMEESNVTETIVEVIVDVSNNETGTDVIEEAGDTICEKFPNLPRCTNEMETSISNPSIVAGVETVEEVITTAPVQTNLCIRFPNLPQCVEDEAINSSEENNVPMDILLYDNVSIVDSNSNYEVNSNGNSMDLFIGDLVETEEVETNDEEPSIIVENNNIENTGNYTISSPILPDEAENDQDGDGSNIESTVIVDEEASSTIEEENTIDLEIETDTASIEEESNTSTEIINGITSEAPEINIEVLEEEKETEENEINIKESSNVLDNDNIEDSDPAVLTAVAENDENGDGSNIDSKVVVDEDASSTFEDESTIGLETEIDTASIEEESNTVNETTSTENIKGTTSEAPEINIEVLDEKLEIDVYNEIIEEESNSTIDNGNEDTIETNINDTSVKGEDNDSIDIEIANTVEDEEEIIHRNDTKIENESINEESDNGNTVTSIENETIIENNDESESLVSSEESDNSFISESLDGIVGNFTDAVLGGEDLSIINLNNITGTLGMQDGLLDNLLENETIPGILTNLGDESLYNNDNVTGALGGGGILIETILGGGLGLGNDENSQLQNNNGTSDFSYGGDLLSEALGGNANTNVTVLGISDGEESQSNGTNTIGNGVGIIGSILGGGSNNGELNNNNETNRPGGNGGNFIVGALSGVGVGGGSNGGSRPTRPCRFGICFSSKDSSSKQTYP